MCSGIVKRLRNHPSIFAWACMNEAFGETLPAKVPQAKNAPLLAVGSALQAMCRELDPSRPTIRNSGVPDDLEAGDSHNYIGSLASGEFLDIYGTTEKLNTEFGFDAPPSEVRLRRVPVLHRRLGPMLGAIASLHDYQYYFLKYFMEHYRMQKYAPCSGYFQFMWIDFCPQSLYGVYDYWGQAKAEGLGGGLQAMRESNQPVGVFLEFKDAPVAIHACNDLPRDLGPCRAEWRAFDGEGRQVAHGEAPVRLGPDSHACVCDVKFEAFKRCRIALRLTDASGAVLAENAYVNPFDMPRRPKHYPQRFDAELGMRTWGA